MLGLKAAGAVRRTEPGRSVIAGSGGTQVAPGAASVASQNHVEERTAMAIGIGAVIDRGTVPGKRIHGRHDGRGDTGPAEDEPTAGPEIGIAVVDGDARVWVRDGRYIGDGPPATTGVGLP